MPRPLKVFRTPIGFHDAYVAALSQKAALKAWGSDADLFARGAAELITDPDLMAEPLAHPGKVIRRARGSVEQHLAALPRDKPARKTSGPSKTASPAQPRPKPSRATLDRLEQKVEKAKRDYEGREAELRAREKALAAERRDMSAQFESATSGDTDALEMERARYEQALEDWRDDA